jgi:hypothetical protein
MKDDMRDTGLDALHDLAIRYCEAVWFARAEVFEDLCHDKFQMTHVENGTATFWDKPAYLDRVRGRDPFPAPAQYDILGLDMAGGEIARVHLRVGVPPVTYEDHLGFVRVDGGWQLLTKVFRTAARQQEE